MAIPNSERLLIFNDIINRLKADGLYITSAQDRVRYFRNFPGLDSPLFVNVSASPTQTSGSYSALECIVDDIVGGVTDYWTSGTSGFGFSTENGLSAIGNRIGVIFNPQNLQINSFGQLDTIQNINPNGSFHTSALYLSGLNSGQVVIVSAGRLITSAINYGGGNNHSLLINLDRDDHTQYLLLTPSSDLRNVIQAIGDFVPFSIVSFPNQIKNLIEIKDTSSGNLFIVSASGDVALQGHLIVSGVGKNLIFSDGSDHEIITPGGMTFESSHQVFQTTSTGMVFKPGMVESFHIEMLSVSAVNQLIVEQNYVRVNSLSGIGNRYVIVDSFGRLTATSAISNGSVSGSGVGTIGRIAKFITSASVGNSIILENGSLISIDGNLQVGNGTSDSTLFLNGANQQNKSIVFETNGVKRGSIGLNSTNEVSANNGSDLEFKTYDVSGTLLDTPVFIGRNLDTNIFLKRSTIITSAFNVSGNATLGSDLWFYGSSNNIVFKDSGNHILSAVNGTLDVTGDIGLTLKTQSNQIFFKPSNFLVMTLDTSLISLFGTYLFNPTNLKVIYLSGSGDKLIYTDNSGNVLKSNLSTSALVSISTSGITDRHAKFSGVNTITNSNLNDLNQNAVQLKGSASADNMYFEIINQSSSSNSSAYLNIQNSSILGNSNSSIYLSNPNSVWYISQPSSTSAFNIGYGSSNPYFSLDNGGLARLGNGLILQGNISATGSIINFRSLSGTNVRQLGVDISGNLISIGAVSSSISGTVNTHAKFVTPSSVGDSLTSEVGTSILNAGNVYSTLTGGGFWIDTLGSFTLGMFKSASSLAFRSGNGSVNRLMILSGGESIFSGYVGTSGNLFVSGTTTLNSFVGTIPTTNMGYNLQGDLNFSSITQYGFVSQPTFNSNAVQLGAAFYSQPNIKNQIFTMGSAIGFYADDVVKAGASPIITTQYGVYVADQTKGVTNYAFWSNAGLVRIGGATSLASTLSVASTSIFGNSITVNDEGIKLNRVNGAGYLNFQNGASVDTWIMARDNVDGALELYSASSTVTGTSAIFRIQRAFNGVPGLSVYTDTGNVLLGFSLNVSGASNFASTFRLTNFSGSSTRVLGIDSNGFVTPLLINSSYVSGSGTTNVVPKFTGPNSIGDSTITDFGSTNVVTINNNLGVSGNTVLSSFLQVNGTVGIGIEADTSFGLYVNSTLLQGSDQYGIVSTPRFTSGAIASVTGYFVKMLTFNSGVVVPNAYGYYVAQASVAESPGTFQNLHGIKIVDITRGSISNYSIKAGLGLVDLGDRLNVSGTSNFKSNVFAFSSLNVSGNINAQANVISQGDIYSGPGKGFWFGGTSGLFTYGMNQNGTNLEFRSGSIGPFLSVNNNSIATFLFSTIFSSTVDIALKLKFTDFGSAADGSIWRDNQSGLSLRGVSATTYDFALYNTSAQYLMRNPHATQNLEMLGALNVSGAISLASTTKMLLYSGSSTRVLGIDSSGFVTPLFSTANSISATGGSNNIVAKFTGPNSLGVSTISDFGSSTNVTVNNSLNVSGSSSFNSVSNYVGSFGRAFNAGNGYFYNASVGINQIVLNSTGANFGFISNPSANTWTLGYGTGETSLGNPALMWNSSGNVNISGTTSVGGSGIFNNSVYIRNGAGIGATLTDRGYLVLGVNGGKQLQFDNDEIQSTNGNSPGDMDFNYGGGNLFFGRGVNSSTLMISTDNSNPLGRLDVRAADGSSLIAAFGDSSNSNRAAYIYFSQTNTLNSGYGVNSDGAELWINYVGYVNSSTRYRNLTIGDGKQLRWVWFDGQNKKVIINNGSTDDGVGILQVNGKIKSSNFYNNSSYSSSIYNAEGSSVPYFQANDGTTIRVKFNPGDPGSGSNYFHAGLAIGANSPTPGTGVVLYGHNASHSTYIVLDKDDNTNYECGIQFSNAGNVKFLLYLDNVSQDYLNIQAAGLIGESDATPRIRLSQTTTDMWLAGSGGNVRIGDVTTPAYKLDINGTDIRLGTTNSNVTLRLETNSGANTGYVSVEYATNRVNLGGNGWVCLNPNSGLAAVFHYVGTSDGRMRIGSTLGDNVVPSSTLYVDGHFAASYKSFTAGATLNKNTFINLEGVGTFTLPSVTACPGRAYFVTRQTSFVGSASVAAAGTDTIIFNGSSFGTLGLVTGTSLILVSDGSSKWYVFNWHA